MESPSPLLTTMVESRTADQPPSVAAVSVRSLQEEEETLHQATMAASPRRSLHAIGRVGSSTIGHRSQATVTSGDQQHPMVDLSGSRNSNGCSVTKGQTLGDEESIGATEGSALLDENENEGAKGPPRWRLNLDRFAIAYKHPDDPDWRKLRSGTKKFYEQQNSIIQAFAAVEEAKISNRSRHHQFHNSSNGHISNTNVGGGQNGGNRRAAPHSASDMNAANQFRDHANLDPQPHAIVEQLDSEDALNKITNKDRERATNFVVNISFAANILLLGSIVTSTILSGSIAIVASLLDSALDFVSALILFATARALKRPNFYKYPSGVRRIEPVAVLLFSSVMGISSLLIITEAIQSIVQFPNERPDVSYAAVGLIVGVVVLKSILWAYCTVISNRYRRADAGGDAADTAIEALAQDHRNDVLVNSAALLTAYLGSVYWPNIDRIGAILIATYTAISWILTCFEQINLLTGRSASPQFLQQLTWLCWNHSDKILYIDTVRSFTFGQRFLVEVDIVLPADMPLKEAHDIGESLQQKIETLDGGLVERAFVHLDWEVSHKPTWEHPATFE